MELSTTRSPAIWYKGRANSIRARSAVSDLPPVHHYPSQKIRAASVDFKITSALRQQYSATRNSWFSVSSLLFSAVSSSIFCSS